MPRPTTTAEFLHAFDEAERCFSELLKTVQDFDIEILKQPDDRPRTQTPDETAEFVRDVYNRIDALVLRCRDAIEPINRYFVHKKKIEVGEHKAASYFELVIGVIDRIPLVGSTLDWSSAWGGPAQLDLQREARDALPQTIQRCRELLRSARVYELQTDVRCELRQARERFLSEAKIQPDTELPTIPAEDLDWLPQWAVRCCAIADEILEAFVAVRSAILTETHLEIFRDSVTNLTAQATQLRSELAERSRQPIIIDRVVSKANRNSVRRYYDDAGAKTAANEISVRGTRLCRRIDAIFLSASFGRLSTEHPAIDDSVPEFSRSFWREAPELVRQEVECAKVWLGDQRSEYSSAREAVSNVAQQLPNAPKVYLSGWREILDSLTLDNNPMNQRRVRNAHESFPGPIIMPAQGGQPKVVKADLLIWWDGLEDRFREDATERDSLFVDRSATVENQFDRGRGEHTETVVSEIGGRVKRRRGSA